MDLNLTIHYTATCITCNREGEIMCPTCDGYGIRDEPDIPCVECNNGYVICPTCNGDGEIDIDNMIHYEVRND